MALLPRRGHFVELVLLGSLALGLGAFAVPAAADDPSSIPPSSAEPPSSVEPSAEPPSSAPPSSVVSVPPSPPAQEFPDVPASHPNVDAIAWARAQGIISGYEDGTFRPEQGVSRVEALKMLYLFLGGTPGDPGAESSFPDVAEDAWYAVFIRRAEADGVVHGYPDGRFRPDNVVSRVELLKMATRVNRLNHYAASGAPRFSDTPLGRWFVPYVNLAVDAGLVDAPGSTFAPNEPMARGDVAELLARLRRALDAGTIAALPAAELRDGVLLVRVSGEGYASFYSDSLAGSGTANGERYDPQATTCAHPSLPFNTLVTVTNPDTGAATVCRVNDRGPYAKRRILDLSRACFEEIERASAGVTLVRWEADVAL